ncbi:MAG: TatD family hydrolase [Desulfurococcaceae archaeon]
MLVDMHAHCHELSLNELDSYRDKYIIVAVSDDCDSSLVTMDIAREREFIRPCIGIHPWNVGEASEHEVNVLLKLAENESVKCLGEVGLDTKFTPQTFNKQLDVFMKFLKLAKDYDLVLNIHAAGAWEQVFNLVLKYDVDKAFFHWYTGPLRLLEEIVDKGFFIGANPAWRVQSKHRSIIDSAPLENIITESDAPYNYKGMSMSIHLVRETVDYIASSRGVSFSSVESLIYNNYKKLFKV